VVARFDSEQQALALMDHPGVAKVLDGGVTDGGRPYFVMELVKGISITEYCDQCGLTNRRRLELFLQVCQAVQHAHQKGIIHRDIKPNNVLIAMQDRRPVPKVIDFGVAKALNQRLTEKTLHTGFAQIVGTPMYMSPEQAEMSPLEVDTRSDIYSLGVLLYELLTGTTPYEQGRLSKASFDELRRIIREEEPPRPSRRLSTLGADALSTIAGRRRVHPRKLSQLVSGDLDWIVMKCLEKDCTRRHETAEALARDLHRHLQQEPIEARPPSARYRFCKFVRRNVAALATASVVALLAVVSVAVSYALIAQERDAAERAADEAREQRDLAESNAKQAEKERKRAEENLLKATSVHRTKATDSGAPFHASPRHETTIESSW
jgi:serine/threonine protein kinase/Ni/Co efflux regulator RcnB